MTEKAKPFEICISCGCTYNDKQAKYCKECGNDLYEDFN